MLSSFFGATNAILDTSKLPLGKFDRLVSRSLAVDKRPSLNCSYIQLRTFGIKLGDLQQVVA
jgi:hypothetical protein